MKKEYLIYLINPKQKYKHYSASADFSILMGRKTISVPLSLPTIAALTPDNYKIRIIDEEVEKLPKKLPDIVGITATTTTVTRGYEIADFYKKNGIPVIMGGAYVSFRSEEALAHADAVVIGEAENIWAGILNDFENGTLKKTYKSETPTEFKRSPIPRWDLVKRNKIMNVAVQVSRGCPFACEFCVVSTLFQRKMKYRDIDNVIEEIKSLPLKTVFFVDDNLTFNKEYARELMTKLKPLNISWICQASIEIGKDDELLELMYEAGCKNILIGFESVNPASLKEAHKNQNHIEEYAKAIDKIHSKGMQLIASFIVGFDNDSLKDMDLIYEFSLANNLPFVMLCLLAATPGSEHFKRMEKDCRLTIDNLTIINGGCPSMHYNNFGQIELFDKYIETINKLFSYETIARKTENLLKYERFRYETTKNEDMNPFEKFGVFLTLVRRFIFTTNKTKRNLFFKLFIMAQTGKLSFERLVVHLMTMEGFASYVENMKKTAPELREIIKKHDKGPWKDQAK